MTPTPATSTSTSASARTAHAHVSAETEMRIRRAAITLFAQRGYAATGIRDIARAAGVTTASIYHYVANKEELLLDIMRVGQVELTDLAERSLQGVERPEDQLSLLVSGLCASHACNRMTTRVSDGEVRSLAPGSPAREEIVRLRDRYEHIWRDVLLGGMAQGIFTVRDEHLTRLALLSMCTGMTQWYRPAGDENLELICRQFVAIALTAVQARRGRRPVSADAVPLIDFELVPQMRWEPQESDDAAEPEVTAP